MLQNATEANDLADVIRTCFRRLPYLAAAAALAAVSAWAGLSLLPPVYEANGSLVVDGRANGGFSQNLLSLPSDGTSRAMLLKTESEVVASLPVRALAIARLSPDERQMLLHADEDKPDTGTPGPDGLTPQERSTFAKRLVVGGEPNSFLVRLRAFAPTADLAAAVANNQMEAYLTFDRERKIESAARLRQAIATETDGLRGRLVDIERELAERQGEEPASVTGQVSVAAGRLEQTYQARDSMRLSLDARQLALKVAQATGDFSGLSTGDDSVARVLADLRSIDQELAASQQGSTAATRLEEQRRVAAGALDAAERAVAERVRAEVELSGTHIAELDRAAAGLEDAIRRGALISDDLVRLRKEAATLGDRLSVLSQQQLEVEAQAEGVESDARIVEVATAPARARSPKPLLGAVASGTLAFAAALALAVWFDRRRRIPGQADAMAASGAVAAGSTAEAERRRARWTAETVAGERLAGKHAISALHRSEVER